MFKPLLRTLPTLSGNIKIACSLSDYTKITSNDFISYVRTARLLPLSSNLSQRNIEANLLYSSYDYDAQKFFKYYSQYFYNDIFEYDKKNYIYLDKTNCQKNRNTDFEFGCKRVSYLKNDAQFAFYTPIYVEGPNDLPDYFKINIILKNNKYEIKKTIRVNISQEIKYNYLRIYLNKYLEKLDSNVIFCNVGNKQATYFGIDLIKGGFTKTIDNIIAKAYTHQNTINNFDAIITNGFQRNNLLMKQILPLCWYFNINSILTGEEKLKFENSVAHISGEWHKDGLTVPFYNIDTNYQSYYESPFIINKSNGMFVYKSNSNNLLNMEYPSLNEAMYQGYRYSNKLNLKYNRWKLKYSEDEHPYVTNLSPAFSINQGSIYKYGGFPEKFAVLNLITDVKNNIIIPIGNALTNNDSPYINDYKLVSNYLNTLNNNVSTWYHLTNDISNIYEEDIWNDVHDDKVYYKGILYDFNKIYEQYPALTEHIDKFSVILNLHFNKLNQDKLKELKKVDTSIFISPEYRTDKTAWISERISEGFSSGKFNELPMFYNTASTLISGNSQLVFDKLYQKSENGNFVDMLSVGFNPYNINKFYKYSDIISKFTEENGYYENIVDVLTNSENFNNYFIEGFEMLPVHYLNNLVHENDRDIAFEAKDSAKWILKNLYFSQHGNYYKSPYDRDTLIQLIKEYGDKNKLIPLYLKSKFISKANFESLMYELYGLNYNILYGSIFNKLTVFEYHPRVKDDTSATYACDVFIEKDVALGDNYGNYIPLSNANTDNDVIYVDTYNLNNIINDYNRRFPENTININTHILSKETYAKFLNMKHLLFYVSDIYKNENNEEDLLRLYNSLYIRKRLAIGDEYSENLKFKDYYIPFYALYDNHKKLTQEEKIAIINGTDANLNDENISFSGISWNKFNELIGDDVPDPIIIDDPDGSIAAEGLNNDWMIENYGISLLENNFNASGIYIKNEDAPNYCTDSYKLVSSINFIVNNYAIFWHCNEFGTHHECEINIDSDETIKVTGRCAKPESGGKFEIYKFNYVVINGSNEYHQEDFYFIPDFYVKSNDEYVPIVDYIKKYASIENDNILNYLNNDILNILVNNDISELNIEELPFGHGRHMSMNPVGFDKIDLKDPNFINNLIELKAEIIKIYNNIKESVYYKISGYDNWIKYNNFTGVNEYVILDNKDMKINILKGDLNITTYIIDENGKFVKKGYDEDEYYTLYNPNKDKNYIKNVVSSFLTDLVFHESNNYFTMSDDYNKLHDLDNLLGIADLNGSYRSNTGFEVVFKKNFYKMNSELFKLMNLEDNEYPYKDLYLYRIYKPDEYPSPLRIYYTDYNRDLGNVEEVSNCLYPLFDDILLQEKKYSVIYSEYSQANIYEATIEIDPMVKEKAYRYNASDIMYMYDISNLPYNKEYKITLSEGRTTLAYTYTYWHELKKLGSPFTNNHIILPTYSLVQNCYSNISYVNDSLHIYDKFNINTYTSSSIESYTYSYTYNESKLIYSNGSYVTTLSEVERTGIGYKNVETTYGFIMLDAYIDNTNSSFNIVDNKYKRKKFFTYINEHDIYDGNYSILDSFNLLVPFSSLHIVDDILNFKNIIKVPLKCQFDTYYKQTEIIDDSGYTYAYNINKKGKPIDRITLQRYFDSIVPYIPKSNSLNSSYCLKFKNYNYPNDNVNYINDVFYNEDINMYNYNKIKVYDENGSYTLYEPLEYKHLNDNKFINLPEYFEINETGKFTYDELIELEQEEIVIEKFKKHILLSKLNTFDGNEILFLFNRYKVEYDTVCVGLNAVKTQKLYTLTYKFTLL